MARSRMTNIAVPGGFERTLDFALERAMQAQWRTVVGYVDRQRLRGGASPALVLNRLERRYLAAVTAIGAASGGVAAAPGVGTAAAIASGAAEIAAFVEATAVFTIGVAEVHGIRLEDPEVRRTVVLAIVLGDAGAAAVEAASVAGSHWAPVLARGVSRDSVGRVNKMLMTRFMTRFGTRQGALVFGRALPFGVGAGIGALGNVALGRAAIRAARRAFGPPPVQFGPRIING